MKNLEESIEHFAELTPDKAAVITGRETLSYASLWSRIQEKAGRLKSEGLSVGKPYVFLTTQDADFIATYLAVHLCGAIAVPLEASTPKERQQQIRDELNGQDTLTSTNGNEMVNGKWSNGKCSDILYTTGTTGQAKGVMLSAKAWTANAENLMDRLGFTSDLLFILCAPLNHLGSLSKIYPTLMSGATLYILESLKDMELLCKILPHSRLFNTYASTETGIVCSYEFSRYGCVPGLLGKPMKHSSVRIGEDGRVICSGATLMSGYVGAPQLTAQVLKGDEIYTSDIGTLDNQGMLRLQGRQDDVINVGGYKVNPSEVEDAAVQVVLGMQLSGAAEMTIHNKQCLNLLRRLGRQMISSRCHGLTPPAVTCRTGWRSFQRVPLPGSSSGMSIRMTMMIPKL